MAVKKKTGLMLRIPEELHRNLVREAKKARPQRSLNEEITMRLERSFKLTNAEKHGLQAMDALAAVYRALGKEGSTLSTGSPPRRTKPATGEESK